MERNFVLALALSFLVLSLWSIYTGGKRPVDPREGFAAEESSGEVFPGPGTGSELARRPTPAAEGARPGAPPSPAGAAEEAPEERVTIQTELYDAEFTTRGGALLRWRLLQYDDASQPGRPQVEITTLDPAGELALATPFEGLGFGDLSHASYRLERPDPMTLVFTLQREDVTLRKTYYLERDSYRFRLRFDVENGPGRHIQPAFRTIWPTRSRQSDDFREHYLAARSQGDVERASVAGGSFLGMGGGSLDEPQQYPPELDWAGSDTPYFLAAMLPDVPREAAARFAPRGDASQVELFFQPVSLPPGQRLSREIRVFLGPKESERLLAAGAHLDEAVSKGWFASLTDFFLWALSATHNFIPNYGFAIIFITILVRLLMAPIMQKQVKSMKRMGEMQPKMKEIQEKYADDRERQSQEMMKLYKESGFNPLTGCLPMFLQLPVFIGLYYALQGTIQLRQEPFIGWIDDLSRPETLFTLPGLEIPVRLLPLLMGGSMVLQQRLTPTTMDPAQARMMSTVMPVMFTFLFYQFASGLVLYWLVSNVLGIAQQVWTNNRPDTPVAKGGVAKPAVAAKAAAKTGGKASRAADSKSS